MNSAIADPNARVGVGPVRLRGRQESERRRGVFGQRCRCRCVGVGLDSREDLAVATQADGDIDHRNDDHQIDQKVLDKSDQRRGPRLTRSRSMAVVLRHQSGTQSTAVSINVLGL